MISDRKRLITIHAAAVLLVWLSSTPSLAEDTAVSHIRPSPFQAHGAAASPPKSVTDACENLRNLREQSGVYRDKLDCVAVQFQTTASETSPGKHAEALAKLSPAVSVNSPTSAVRTEETISHLTKALTSCRAQQRRAAIHPPIRVRAIGHTFSIASARRRPGPSLDFPPGPLRAATP